MAILVFQIRSYLALLHYKLSLSPRKFFQRTKSTTMICMAFEVIEFGTIRILATNGDHDAGRYELRKQKSGWKNDHLL